MRAVRRIVPTTDGVQPPLVFWYATGDALLDSVQSSYLWQALTVQQGPPGDHVPIRATTAFANSEVAEELYTRQAPGLPAAAWRPPICYLQVGQVVGMIKEETSVRDVMYRMQMEYLESIDRLNKLTPA